jgi:hypothetical protein
MLSTQRCAASQSTKGNPQASTSEAPRSNGETSGALTCVGAEGRASVESSDALAETNQGFQELEHDAEGIAPADV